MDSVMWVMLTVQSKSYLAFRFGKKEQYDHCRVKVEVKHYWNWKNQIQDPIFPHGYELNIVSTEADQNFVLMVQC